MIEGAAVRAVRVAQTVNSGAFVVGWAIGWALGELWERRHAASTVHPR